jgi:hypothetical protein
MKFIDVQRTAVGLGKIEPSLRIFQHRKVTSTAFFCSCQQPFRSFDSSSATRTIVAMAPEFASV